MTAIDRTRKSKLEAVATTVRKGVTLEQLIEEQNYKPITYADWRAKADKIEWKESLEELLEAAK